MVTIHLLVKEELGHMHAKDGVLAIADLDSKNGVLVDDRKVKKAGVLGDGSRISVGSHLFDVKIIDAGLREKSTEKAHSQQAKREVMMPMGEPAGAMKLSVDIDSVTQGDSLGQLISVGALVAVIVFIAFFCVQIATCLVIKSHTQHFGKRYCFYSHKICTQHITTFSL